MKVGVYHGYVHSSLLFIIAMEALSCEFVSGAPWEDLSGDHLVSITYSLKKCVRRLLIQKEAMEEKGFRVHIHDVRYRTGPPAEIRQVLMRILSYSRQQQHPLQMLHKNAKHTT